MARVTTLYAGTAATTAAYYTAYLTKADGELPGKWMGRQATAFGLSDTVSTEQLEALLSGRDPIGGTPLGNVLVDRTRADGTVVRGVAGFDATLSAPKSLSAWWALPAMIGSPSVATSRRGRGAPARTFRRDYPHQAQRRTAAPRLPRFDDRGVSPVDQPG